MKGRIAVLLLLAAANGFIRPWPHIIHACRFFVHTTADFHCISMVQTTPKIACPFYLGDRNPHLIHGSLGPPDLAPQTVSQSVQPFVQGSRTRPTDRQTEIETGRHTVTHTEWPKHSVCSNRPLSLAISVMQLDRCLARTSLTRGMINCYGAAIKINQILQARLHPLREFSVYTFYRVTRA